MGGSIIRGAGICPCKEVVWRYQPLARIHGAAVEELELNHMIWYKGFRVQGQASKLLYYGYVVDRSVSLLQK